jgi:hypothetical protein
MVDRAPLRIVSPDATPEEVAAIAAAISAVLAERDAAARAATASAASDRGEGLDAWVRATRLSARRSGLDRGPWRLSGRIGRRARA